MRPQREGGTAGCVRAASAEGVPRHPSEFCWHPPRCASCATPDAGHNWHGSRYANALDMVLPRVCCEILQGCPLLRLLLLRGW
jgi:hypothetical protein